MKLLIDSGNTRLKWQVLGEDGECLGEGVSGAQTARAVTLAQAVRRFGPQLRQIVIAHVAGAAPNSRPCRCNPCGCARRRKAGA